MGAFFVGHATSSGGGSSLQPISAADAVNATADANSAPAGQCTLPDVTDGTLKSVNGSTLTITDRSGKDVTVTTSSSTTIVKIESGTVGDVTPGQMIGVHGTSTGQNAITADDIAIIPAIPPQKLPNLGKLPQRAGRLGQRLGLALGTVKSVSGNTIVVQEPDGTSVTVTTSSSTKVQKAVTVQAKDLTVSQPVAATGTAGTGGSIAARYVVQGNGDLGFKGFGLGGLGLPRIRHSVAPGWGGKAPEPPNPAAPPAAG
jgi:hypothetical protein